MKRVGKSISTSEKLGTGTKTTVRRIALEYTNRGQLSKVTSHNNATVGSGTIVNQVTLSYNAFNQLIGNGVRLQNPDKIIMALLR